MKAYSLDGVITVDLLRRQYLSKVLKEGPELARQTSERRIPRKGNNQYKSPKIKACLACCRSRRSADVARG